MPLFQDERSIPAVTVIDNILAGSQWEFLPYDASLEFGLVGDATASDLRLDVYTGSDVLAENMQPSAANRIPIRPDDFNLTDVAVGGERIKIRVRNLHATLARTLFTSLIITPIGG